jgi:hypothetical protein
MCLCKLVIFTFSNKTAFRRLEHKLKQLDEELKHKCYPEGTAWIVTNTTYYTPQARDEFPYEMLRTLADMYAIHTNHIHFKGWDEYRAMRKTVGDQDVFGHVEVKVT